MENDRELTLFLVNITKEDFTREIDRPSPDRKLCTLLSTFSNVNLIQFQASLQK